jgi:AcrR family transcriptional regulator
MGKKPVETLVTIKVSLVLRPQLAIMEAKERITLQAEELFIKYGIRSVSMDDIANNLGMSKKTIYQFFSDKDELVEAVVLLHIGRIQTDCTTCNSQAKNAIEEIYLTIDRIMEEFTNMNPVLLYDLHKFHPRAYQLFKNHKDKFLLEFIRKNIEWGIRDELYRPDLDVDVLSKFRIESMMIPFNVSVFPPGKYTLAHTSEVIIENFIFGLVTIRGYKLIQKYREQRQKTNSYEEQKK